MSDDLDIGLLSKPILKAVCWMIISLCSDLICVCLVLCLPACLETTAH